MWRRCPRSTSLRQQDTIRVAAAKNTIKSKSIANENKRLYCRGRSLRPQRRRRQNQHADGTRQDYQLSNNDPKRSKPETIKSEVIRLLDLNGDGKIDQ